MTETDSPNVYTTVAELMHDFYFRYRRKNHDGSKKQQNKPKITEYENDTFTSDYDNIGKYW